ncbi:aminoglycoside phosphotransferase [Nitrosospira lacus]|uniref:Aminoglycoside phosphotransferase n=2 Tax=Nitrosospira lacus TaxID=1288494 RepID=A0A1W6SRD6_9PROT|nr:aminoglycoside phosphotransferase [Nitrosospira lacus]
MPTAAMKHNILANHPDGLTDGWAQQIVNSHYPNVMVSSVAIVSVQVGTTTRIRLSVKHNGPEKLPRQWFVKLPSLAWRARLITALPRLLHTEVRFYNEAAQAVPVAMPGILAAQSSLGRGAILVLTDVTESGGVTGNPADALTVEQALLVVQQLARLHAHFWNKADLEKTYYWLNGPVRRLEDHLGTALAVPLMKRGLRQAGKLISRPLHASAIHYAQHRRRVMHYLSNTPQTLVHHDCHPGNLFWSRSKPGLLDWQLVRVGEGVGDVAYFLATALDPKVRRLHEANLLSIYGKELRDHGIAGIDTENLMRRYRAHLTYPFEAMVVSLAVGGMMELESNHELIRRTAAAIEDLDAFSAIPI